MTPNSGIPSEVLPGMQVKNFIWIAVAVLVIIIVIIAIKKGSHLFDGITGAFDNVLETLHLKDSAEATAANEAVANADPFATSTASPFNPTFYKTAPGGSPLIGSASLVKLAAQIYDSVGVFYDDPESGFGAFKQCRTWAQVSQLCDMFNVKYGKDAYSWLKLKYDTTSQKDVLAKIVNYCKALPKYA